MPESQPTMPKIKSLKATTLIQSIRFTFSLRRRLGCSSSSSSAVIRMSANKCQPNTNKKKKNMTKHKKVVVANTKNRNNRRLRQQQQQQQFVDLESPPSPASSDSSSDSVFSSNKSFRDGLHFVARDTVDNNNNTQRPTRRGRVTFPLNTAALDIDSVFRKPRSVADDFKGIRYQHRARQNSSEELTEILKFQTNLLIGRSKESHDKFRDWRLDTDDMTYEQLLALGDKIGHVCTGLKEGEILRCVKKTKFLGKTSSSLRGEAELKCTICQEEYEPKDKLGLLFCSHLFHHDCIKQWLTHKKICPVCKSEVTAQH